MSRCRYRYDDLPAWLKAQVDEQLRKCPTQPQPPCPAVLTRPEVRTPAVASSKRRGPNKTESAYWREILERRTDVLAIHFEGITIRMANGHRYTPDWIVVTSVRRIECHEVKGRYALQSQQRARLAFDQVRVEFPWFVWVWAVKTPAGWAVEQNG